MRYVAQVNAARCEVGRNQHFKAAFLEIEHCISRDPPAISPVVVLSSTDPTANSLTIIPSVTETFFMKCSD